MPNKHIYNSSLKHHFLKYFFQYDSFVNILNYLHKYIIRGKHIGKLTYNPQNPTPETTHSHLHLSWAFFRRRNSTLARHHEWLQSKSSGFYSWWMQRYQGVCKGKRQQTFPQVLGDVGDVQTAKKFLRLVEFLRIHMVPVTMGQAVFSVCACSFAFPNLQVGF